jgi:hypothetical protein
VNRTELAAYVAEVEVSEPDPGRRVALVVLAADEYAAHLVDECARLPQQATIAAAVWRERALVADEIATSLETLAASAPATSHGERARLAQALDDAATARRIGRTHCQPQQVAS